MFHIPQSIVNPFFGEDAILYVNSGKIDTHAGSAQPYARHVRDNLGKYNKYIAKLARKGFGLSEPFIMQDSHFPMCYPLMSTDRFVKMAEIVQNPDDYENSTWYSQLMSDLDKNGVGVHKRIRMKSKEDVVLFFKSYILPLIESLQKDGYRRTANEEVGNAVIDARGRIVKASNANHRFAIGHILGLKDYPLRIKAVHEDWVKDNNLPNPILGRRRWVVAFRQIEEDYT